MERYEFGNPNSTNVLIQMIGDHELLGLEKELAYIRKNAGEDFFLIAFKVDDWNKELSPWKAPAVFGDEAFGGFAGEMLAKVLEQLNDIGRQKKYCIGGYSLAGLFALWAAYETDLFTAVAAASPSIWFPGFIDHMKSRSIHADKVYLSLGNREAKTRNPVMATVADCIEMSFDLLKLQGVDCTLEWNEGNHFKEAEIRTAKAFAWVLN